MNFEKKIDKLRKETVDIIKELEKTKMDKEVRENCIFDLVEVDELLDKTWLTLRSELNLWDWSK